MHSLASGVFAVKGCKALQVVPIYEHLFEYIATQFPPPSSLLYGKMGSITLFFFQMGILDMIQHFMHVIGRQFTLFHFLLQ